MFGKILLQFGICQSGVMPKVLQKQSPVFHDVLYLTFSVFGYPAVYDDGDKQLEENIECVKQIVGNVRTVRNQKNISPKEQLELQVIGVNKYADYDEMVLKMANIGSINVVDGKAADCIQFMVGTDEYAIPVGNLIDVKAEIEKQEAQLKHLEGFLAGIKKKLSNEKFVANAPEAVVAMERKKKKDSEEKIAVIRESLKALK